jgi:hypothetical protein
VIFGAGVVTMAVGGVIVLMNMRTGESQETQSAAHGGRFLPNLNVASAEPPFGDHEARQSWKRTPTFREPTVLDKMAPTPSTFSIFSTSF